MYAYLKGSLEFTATNYAVVEVSGVGYKVYMSSAELSRLPAKGNAVMVYTHLHVREDMMDLYGFLTQDELLMFEMVISVSGVGPKVGLSLLSAMSPSSFALAVVNNDPKSITKAQGVGLKLAQRIILELKDKLKGQDYQAAGIDIGQEADIQSSGSEAISALVVLGYSPQEAKRVVSKITGVTDVEGIIKEALKLMMKQ